MRQLGRRWHFAEAILDESSWTLTVFGTRATIEPRPLELLHELLLRAGDVVTKDELFETVWPGVTVVEASLTSAMLKLRRALRDDPGSRIIETVPRIGYRLAVPVEVVFTQPESKIVKSEMPLADVETILDAPLRHKRAPARRWRMAAVGLTVICIVGLLAVAKMIGSSTTFVPRFTQQDAVVAIRRLDVERIEALLRAGWNPSTPWDNQGNGALNAALTICEWDPAHDRKRLLLMARTLIDGGARVDTRNVWGDTAYSIAKAKRYCGPEHPVTRMMHAQCYTGYKPPRDNCLATYELERRKSGAPRGM